MSLKDYFPASDHAYKKEFDALLKTLHFHPALFSYIAHIKSGRYYHVSPSFEALTFHKSKELEDLGVNFFLEYVPREDILLIMKQQAEAYESVHRPDFDPQFPYTFEMNAHIRKPNGGYVTIVGIGTPMAYLPSGEFDFVLIVGYVRSGDEVIEKQSKREAIEFLRHAKKLYCLIYPQPALRFKPPVITEIVIDAQNRKVLTQKEKEVLRHVAKGLSSKEIAHDLAMSENTVETHRKNIFQKFEAKNAAELIKKASKQFWLE